VARGGSLSAAARTLGVNHSTVFRRVNAIEEKTGVRFFDRLPRGYPITEAGRTALRYGERVEAEFHALDREILGQDLRLQGNVVVTSPLYMAVTMLPQLVAAFRKQHPGIHVQTGGSAVAKDLRRREADVAIRATSKPPETSFGRRVCDFRFAIYASPGYVAGREHIPLNKHDWCLIHGVENWLAPHFFERSEDVVARRVFGTDSTTACLSATALGMGLTLLPCYAGDPDPRLIRVADPIEGRTLQLWLLTHPDLRHTARVKALMAFFYEAMSERRALFDGTSGAGDVSVRLPS